MPVKHLILNSITLLLIVASTSTLKASVDKQAQQSSTTHGIITDYRSDSLDGQLNLILTEQSRELVSHKAQFRGLPGQGTLTLTSNDQVSLDIYVNQQLVATDIKLVADKPNKVDIHQFTRAGTNYLHLANLSNAAVVISARIPFPVLKTEPEANPYDFSAVDTLIQADIEAGFPGAVLAVVKNGQLIKHQAYGYAQRYARDGKQLAKPDLMTKDTLFDLASNTKMYATNYALMKLVSENKLNVDLPIHHYIAEYLGEGREERLVKDLLIHTAGYAPSTPFYDRKRTGKLGLFSQDRVKTKDLLVSKLGFKTNRNEAVVYSDNDYLLLGILIERITGMPLDSYVEKHIFAPLSLKSSRFNPLQKGFEKNDIAATELAGNSRGGRIQFENIRTNVLRGEVHDEKAFYSMAGVAGHAGLFSTAIEVAKLANLILNRGGQGEVQIFSPDVIDQFLKPSSQEMTMGLGWRRAANGSRTWQFGPYASPYAVGHTGWTGTVTIIDPFHELIIVLLTNRKHTVVFEEDGRLIFRGDRFETGRYGSVITLIYEAILKQK